MRSGNRIAIVGAGIAGLVCAKVLTEDGFTVEVFDRAPDIGGVWSETRRYPGLRAQSTKSTYHFSDHPMPADYPRVLDGARMQEYLSSYVRAFGLTDRLRLRTEVVAADPVDGGWLLEIRDADGVHRTSCDHLIIANGVFSEPEIPDFPGATAFARAGGQLGHSTQFLDVEAVRDRAVVVVGYGAAAADLATEISKLAAETTMVARRLLWKMPRRLAVGVDAERVLLTRTGAAHFGHPEPGRIERLLHGPARSFRESNLDLIEALVAQRSGAAELGLVPEGRFDQAHDAAFGLATEGFADQVTQGRLAVLGGTEVKALGGGPAGPFAELSDGRRVRAEIVVCATGFQQRVRFLTPYVQRQLTDEDGNFRLYRQILPLDVPHLTFAGYNTSLLSAVSAEIGAHWTAALLTGNLALPPIETMSERIDTRLRWLDQHTGGRHARGTVTPDAIRDLDELLADLGVRLPLPARTAQWLRPVRPSDYRVVSRRKRGPGIQSTAPAPAEPGSAHPATAALPVVPHGPGETPDASTGTPVPAAAVAPPVAGRSTPPPAAVRPTPTPAAVPSAPPAAAVPPASPAAAVPPVSPAAAVPSVPPPAAASAAESPTVRIPEAVAASAVRTTTLPAVDPTARTRPVPEVRPAAPPGASRPIPAPSQFVPAAPVPAVTPRPAGAAPHSPTAVPPAAAPHSVPVPPSGAVPQFGPAGQQAAAEAARRAAAERRAAGIAARSNSPTVRIDMRTAQSLHAAEAAAQAPAESAPVAGAFGNTAPGSALPPQPVAPADEATARPADSVAADRTDSPAGAGAAAERGGASSAQAVPSAEEPAEIGAVPVEAGAASPGSTVERSAAEGTTLPGGGLEVAESSAGSVDAAETAAAHAGIESWQQSQGSGADEETAVPTPDIGDHGAPEPADTAASDAGGPEQAATSGSEIAPPRGSGPISAGRAPTEVNSSASAPGSATTGEQPAESDTEAEQQGSAAVEGETNVTASSSVDSAAPAEPTGAVSAGPTGAVSAERTEAVSTEPTATASAEPTTAVPAEPTAHKPTPTEPETADEAGIDPPSTGTGPRT